MPELKSREESVGTKGGREDSGGLLRVDSFGDVLSFLAEFGELECWGHSTRITRSQLRGKPRHA